MIYYVFLQFGTEHEYAKLIADSICSAWGKRFKESQIQYTDYDTLYGSFREKIFGIFFKKEFRQSSMVNIELF